MNNAKKEKVKRAVSKMMGTYRISIISDVHVGKLFIPTVLTNIKDYKGVDICIGDVVAYERRDVKDNN